MISKSKRNLDNLNIYCNFKSINTKFNFYLFLLLMLHKYYIEHKMNMAFYWVGLEVKVKELLLQVKMQIQIKAGRDIRYTKVIFKRCDANGKENLILRSLNSDFISAKKHMPLCNFVFLFRSSHELKLKNQRRCVPLGGRASHRAEHKVRRVVEFHFTGNHYFYIYNLFNNNFKRTIPFFMNNKIN